VQLLLTPGQASDLGQAEPLIEDIELGALLADKAYDADRLIELLTRRRITPVIPPTASRAIKRACDFALY
jgi:transposase